MISSSFSGQGGRRPMQMGRSGRAAPQMPSYGGTAPGGGPSPFLGGGQSGGGQPTFGSGKLAAPSGGGQGIQYSAFGTIRPPQYIDDDLTSRVTNNQLAFGDAQADLGNLKKEFATPGRSAGKGEDYRARVASAAIQQNSRADAMNTALNDIAQNSKMRTDYEYARETEGQRLSALQHALGQSQWADQMSIQQDAARRLAAQQSAQIQILGPLLDLYLSQMG